MRLLAGRAEIITGTGMVMPVRPQGQERPCISSRELPALTKGGQKRKTTMKKLLFVAILVVVTVTAAPASLTGADTSQVGLDMLESAVAAAREDLAAAGPRGRRS